MYLGFRALRFFFFRGFSIGCIQGLGVYRDYSAFRVSIGVPEMHRIYRSIVGTIISFAAIAANPVPSSYKISAA